MANGSVEWVGYYARVIPAQKIQEWLVGWVPQVPTNARVDLPAPAANGSYRLGCSVRCQESSENRGEILMK